MEQKPGPRRRPRPRTEAETRTNRGSRGCDWLVPTRSAGAEAVAATDAAAGCWVPMLVPTLWLMAIRMRSSMPSEVIGPALGDRNHTSRCHP